MPVITIAEEGRRDSMVKEDFFCKKYKEQIETRTKKIYENRFCCSISL